MWRRKYKHKYILCLCLLVYTYQFLGIGDYMYARSYDHDFDYPLDMDLRPVVDKILSNSKSDVSPINFYPYRYLTESRICETVERLDLFIIVKSAVKNEGHRLAIRQTYGQETFYKGRIVKTLFFLGTDESQSIETQLSIDKEIADFADIIQIDFKDNYYNNTIKTMMSFRWAYNYCPNADFYLFTDDDMYISVDNLLDYVNEETSTKHKDSHKKERDDHLFAGYVFKSAPQRFKISKWRVSLEEYPWDMWPPYVTAGAYVLSNQYMKMMYIGSFFVKHFRFDDIYLGIIAKKIGIVPKHCTRFHFYKAKYTKDGYRDVIASHGYDNHVDLLRVWNEQNNVSSIF